MDIPRQIRQALRLTKAASTRCRLAIFLGLSTVVISALAQDRKAPSEYEVKAAFLLNFTRFIEWPRAKSEDAPFKICVLGHDPFNGALERIVNGESVNGRRLVVENIRSQEHHACQILFVGHSEKLSSDLLSELGAGVLTVGEGDGFIREGGMIAFILENHHVRFDINLPAANNAALKLSSKLLSVARSVEK